MKRIEQLAVTVIAAAVMFGAATPGASPQPTSTLRGRDR